MANYIAWYGKKRQHLLEREREFSLLLQHEADADKIADAAQEVRAAQVRALKSKRAQLGPSARLDREIEFWLGLSVEQIVDGYRSGKLRGHRSTAVRRYRRGA